VFTTRGDGDGLRTAGPAAIAPRMHDIRLIRENPERFPEPFDIGLAR
jgi:hypothetical protein